MAAFGGPSEDHQSPRGGLVGREREQGALCAALDAALAGRGGLAIINGAAGLGKTTLAEWLCGEAAARGVAVLVGRAYDLSETPPYGPWAEALARAPTGDGLPTLPAPLLLPASGGEALPGSDAILARARAYLAALAARRPLVILLDDLHWADPASLNLLRAVARGLGDVPLLLLATCRDDELAPGHPFQALVPVLVREARPIRLDLRPLDDAAVGALVAARYPLAAADHARLVRHLLGRTEGNPLFVGEVLRTLDWDGLLRREGDGWALGELAAVPVPPLLRQVIAARLARLAPETQRLLAVAAVLGQEVPLAAWAAVGGVAEVVVADHAERASEARLLSATADGAGVRFGHALIREALYEASSPMRRRALHRQSGEALAATSRPDPDAVAYHFGRAGDARAVEWLIRAGLRAYRAAAWVSAAERFAAAVAALDGEATRARERGWLLLACGELLHFSDTAQSLRALDAAEPLALAAGDQILLAYLRFTRGRFRCLSGSLRRGLAEMDRAITALDALPGDYNRLSSRAMALATIEALLRGEGRVAAPPASGVAQTTLNRANLLHWLALAGRYRDAQLQDAVLRSGQRTTEGGEERPSAAAAHLGRGHLRAALGLPDEARRDHALALEGHHAQADLVMAQYTAWVELLMVVLPYRTDDIAARARLAAEGARAWAQAIGNGTTATHGAQSGLPLALLEGRWAEAHRLAEDGRASAIVGFSQGAIVALGALARWQGEPGATRAWIRALHPAGPATAPGDCFYLHGLAALALATDLALDAGDLDAAGAWLDAHGRWLDWSGAILWRADHLLLQARHARLAGDHALAQEHAEAALVRATEPRQPLALLAAHRLLGELATEAVRHDEAVQHLGAALALAEACAAPYERALTLLARAELAWAVGDRDGADAALATARGILTPLVARPALARADALAARRALLRPPAQPAGLTAREADVLRLVAAGRSNREAAAALSVSERTVERHLENAYRKLGARNRADAVAFAIRHHLA